MVENEPGRPGDARPGRGADLPARARRTPSGPAGDEQPPPTRTGPRSSTLLGLLWVVALVVVAVVLAGLRAADLADRLDLPARLDQVAAAVLGILLTVGLAARSGARLVGPVVLALGVGVAAVVSRWEPLLAGAAVATGVLAACLAVLGTRPASGPVAVVREVVVAQLVAAAGALGVAGFAADLDADRFTYTVLGLSLVATIALVHRLGGGLHGLGRRGAVVGLGAIVLLAVGLAYTAALSRYGSPELTRQVSAVQDWTHEHLGGAPHPIEALLGIPALVWGVSMRDRRRQGWWVCAFGTTTTAVATSRLIDPGATTLETVLGAAYTLVVGLLVGALVIRLARGFAPRRLREGSRHRPEPPRLRALH